MKIAVYVNQAYAKANYKNESYNTRAFVGIEIIKDVLQKEGHIVEYCDQTRVQEFDYILVSITSDCDWWPFIAERMQWAKGNYKVVVGGAGVLNVRPFLSLVDCFVLGRGENLIGEIVKGKYQHNSVIWSDEFSMDKIYKINQRSLYPYALNIKNTEYKENEIGCNHKCLFCGYTWHRQRDAEKSSFDYTDNIYGNSKNRELAILDMGDSIDLAHLRTTAIDGFSQRLRYAVNKRISNEMVEQFYKKLIQYDGKPHQLKIYNIVGYPSETMDDWQEFLKVLKSVDELHDKAQKQWSIVLHNTPFRATPCTPVATWPMEYTNFRGLIGRKLGKGLKNGLIYQGNRFWAVESMGTESLASVIMSAIVIRGTESDTGNIIKVAQSKKFSTLDTATKVKTLEKYFNVKNLFREYTDGDLPTRNIHGLNRGKYAKVPR